MRRIGNSKNLFHRGHYNIVAASIRATYELLVNIPVETQWEIDLRVAQASPIYEFMLQLCERFVKDNPEFDAVKFLDACSPDPDQFPFSELWDTRTNSRAAE
jgi:hypothetical protein